MNFNQNFRKQSTSYGTIKVVDKCIKSLFDNETGFYSMILLKVSFAWLCVFLITTLFRVRC